MVEETRWERTGDRTRKGEKKIEIRTPGVHPGKGEKEKETT